MQKPVGSSPAQRRLQAKFEQQELRFEQRFDALVAQLQQERAAARTLCESLQATYAHTAAVYAETRAAYERARQERERLRGVLTAKQQVIDLLLPFYPHPISPKLRQQIELS